MVVTALFCKPFPKLYSPFERQAKPGEFTKTRLSNNRMDLSQAEAVAELIAAPSRDAIRYSMNRMDGVFWPQNRRTA